MELNVTQIGYDGLSTLQNFNASATPLYPPSYVYTPAPSENSSQYPSTTPIPSIEIFLGEVGLDEELFDELMGGLGYELIQEFTTFLKGDNTIEEVLLDVIKKILDRTTEELASGSGDLPDDMIIDILHIVSRHLPTDGNVEENIRHLGAELLQEIRNHVGNESEFLDGVLKLLTEHLSSQDDFETMLRLFMIDYLNIMKEQVSGSGLFSDLNNTFEGDILLIVLEAAKSVVNGDDIWATAETLLRSFHGVLQNEHDSISEEDTDLLFIINIVDAVADNIGGSTDVLVKIQNLITDVVPLARAALTSGGTFYFLEGTTEGNVLSIVIDHVEMFTSIETSDDFEALVLSFIGAFADFSHDYTEGSDAVSGTIVPELLDMVKTYASSSPDMGDMVKSVIDAGAGIIIDHIASGDLSFLGGTIEGDIIKLGLKQVRTALQLESLNDFEGMALGFIENFAEYFYNFVEGPDVDVGSLVPEMLSIIKQKAATSGTIIGMLQGVIDDCANAVLEHLSSGDLTDLSDSIEGDVLKITMEHLQLLINDVDDDESFEDLALSFVQSYTELFYEFTTDGSDIDIDQFIPAMFSIVSGHASSASNFENLVEPVITDLLELLLNQLSESGDLADLAGSFEGDVNTLIVQHIQRFMVWGWDDLEANVRGFIKGYLLLGVRYTSVADADVPQLIPDLLQVFAKHIEGPWDKDAFTLEMESLFSRYDGVYGDLSQMLGLVEYMDLLQHALESFFSLDIEFDGEYIMCVC